MLFLCDFRSLEMGKKPEPSKNEPNQNPKVKIVQEPEPNRTRTQIAWFLIGSFTE